MTIRRLFSLEFFPTLSNREEFFQKITQDDGLAISIFGQYALLLTLSFAYGVVMGSYYGVAQALVAGVKIAVLFSLVLVRTVSEPEALAA